MIPLEEPGSMALIINQADSPTALAAAAIVAIAVH